MRAARIRARPRRTSSSRPPSKPRARDRIQKGRSSGRPFCLRPPPVCGAPFVPLPTHFVLPGAILERYALCFRFHRLANAARYEEDSSCSALISRLRFQPWPWWFCPARSRRSAGRRPRPHRSREQGAGPALLRAHRAPDSAPAVVNVYASPGQNAAAERGHGRFLPPLLRRGTRRGVPRGRSQSSLGSGVIVDPSGLVVTNNHVIENMTEVKVALADRREFEADIVLRDPRTDLAVLKLKNAAEPAVLRARRFRGAARSAISSSPSAIPFGVGQTVTQGIVSALARTQVGVSDYQFFIQTDAAINPGNSGGALDRHERPPRRHQHGDLFPLRRQPSASASPFRRAWSGRCSIPPSGGARTRAAALARRAPSDRRRRDRDEPRPRAPDGRPGRPPSTTRARPRMRGLKRGDAILAVDGQPVDNPDAFGYRFTLKGIAGPDAADRPARRQAGDRHGQAHAAARDAARASPRGPRPVAVRRRDPREHVAGRRRRAADRAFPDDGVVVADLEDAASPRSVGFQKGDQILAINGQRLSAHQGRSSALRNGRPAIGRSRSTAAGGSSRRCWAAERLDRLERSCRLEETGRAGLSLALGGELLGDRDCRGRSSIAPLANSSAALPCTMQRGASEGLRPGRHRPGHVRLSLSTSIVDPAGAGQSVGKALDRGDHGASRSPGLLQALDAARPGMRTGFMRDSASTSLRKPESFMAPP